MNLPEKETWYVAVKIFLRDGDKLLIIKDVYDDGWDLPGGRIRKNEFTTPLLEIADRKMKEEIGLEVKYQIEEQPKIFFRHERLEVGINENIRIFALGYEAKYLGGVIDLGEYIDKYEWVDLKNFKPEDYFKGGWLAGVVEYQRLNK